MDAFRTGPLWDLLLMPGNSTPLSSLFRTNARSVPSIDFHQSRRWIKLSPNLQQWAMKTFHRRIVGWLLEAGSRPPQGRGHTGLVGDWFSHRYSGGMGLGLMPLLFMYEINWSGISANTSLANRAMLRTWFPVRSM